MKDFFKNVLSSAIGFLLGSVLLIVFVVILLSAVVATLGTTPETTVKDGSVLELTLDQEIPERTSKNPLEGLDFNNLSSLKRLGLNDIIKNIEKAGRDSRIKGIFLHVSSVPAGPAKMEEIRNALLSFRKKGKFIYAYGEYYGQSAYYLASAADMVCLQPEGGIDFRGLGMELMFFKGAMDKLGIESQIIRHGKFKSAIEPFVLDKMSPENRMQLEQLAGSVWQRMLSGISDSRKVSIDRLQAVADSFAARNAADALRCGLIDKVCQYDEFLELLSKKCGWEKPGKEALVSLSSYDNAYVKSEKPYSSDKIAIIYANGDIKSGKGDDRVIGSLTTAAELRKARLDSSVKAIVLRINSPGGSALASDVIWREVTLAKKAKPLVASMGDYAASGGYYIACAADSILAQPTTITGSIGVFGLGFSAQKMFNEKLGITFDTVKTGRYADMGTVTRPMRKDEQEMTLRDIEMTYDVFVSHVAEGRKMEKQAVDSVGQGRVWSGTDAIAIGLVDKLGNLSDAVEMAARMAKLENYRTVELPRQKELFEVLMEDLSDGAETWVLKNSLGDDYRYYDAIREAREQEGILARMPFGITIR